MHESNPVQGFLGVSNVHCVPSPLRHPLVKDSISGTASDPSQGLEQSHRSMFLSGGRTLLSLNAETLWVPTPQHRGSWSDIA